MPRRVFCSSIRTGSFALPAAEAHHLRDVLRTPAGETVELFDAGGQIATATIERSDADGVIVRVAAIERAAAGAVSVTVASAVPKADRADWLVEKLSELGVEHWIPLKTARSVVHPAGDVKLDRWRRIAIEAAKQSRRTGVMEIGTLTDAATLSFEGTDAILLSTRQAASPLVSLTQVHCRRLLLIGPEGGWTDEELTSLASRGAREASMTSTVLRIETAAVVAAGTVILSAAKDPATLPAT